MQWCSQVLIHAMGKAIVKCLTNSETNKQILPNSIALLVAVKHIDLSLTGSFDNP